MRGVICYYSGSGNTRLACEHLAARVGIDLDLVDVIGDSKVDLASYDIVGLAAPTDFGGMPQRFETFIRRVPDQQGKPAFLLNTFGFMSGRTLRDMADRATSRGFEVLGGHSLRMPEDYPPMIALHLGFDGQPTRSGMRAFDAFIDGLASTLGALQRGEAVAPRPVRIGLLSAASRTRARTAARDDMGDKSVDAELCTECGLCEQRCPYRAITLSPKPVFDMGACYGCWRCYNQCPQHAIYTARFRGGPYYPGPSRRTRETLEA